MQATQLCPSPHIEAADLNGAEKVVTIKGYDFHNVGAEQVKKGVLFYDEFERGMVINRTNVKRIIAIHGNNADEWKGKKITLYPSETDYAGKTVPCIRVREKAPA